MRHFSPSVSSHGQKMSQMTQFYILTHFDVFCESVIFNIIQIYKLNMLEGRMGERRKLGGSSCVPFWSHHAFLNKFNTFKRLVFGPIPAICHLHVMRMT